MVFTQIKTWLLCYCITHCGYLWHIAGWDTGLYDVVSTRDVMIISIYVILCAKYL